MSPFLKSRQHSKRNALRIRALLLASLIVSLMANLKSAPAQSYQLVDLGTLGGLQSSANAINEKGSVVGWSYTNGIAGKSAYLWRPGLGMTNLGNLGGDTEAFDINIADQVVGRSGGAAFLWTNGLMIDLGFPVPAAASGINDSGQIAGSFGNYPDALLWQNGVIIPLLSSGGNLADWAAKINNRGNIAGSFAQGNRSVGIWYGGTNRVKFVDDAETGGMNNLDWVTGHRGAEAFVWTTNYIKIGLGYAHDVNDFGQVVGELEFAQTGRRAFLWKDHNGNGAADAEEINDLNTLVEAPDWLFKVAYGINNSGAIVGEGSYEGQTRAFLLSLPPVITKQPTNQVASLASSVTFQGEVNGLQPIYFQWFFNGTNLLNQTNSSLVLFNVSLLDEGQYSFTVSNLYGVAISSNASLRVLDFRNASTNDTDGDSIADYDEVFVRGTSPLTSDTDGDGIPDDWELQYGLNPISNDADADLDLDGVSNGQEYQQRAFGYRPNNADSFGDGQNDAERLFGTQTNRFYYDRADRLIGADYNRGSSGFAIGYVYDGNGNLLRQKHFSRDANGNGLPDIWEFLNGLTNSPGTYADTDGDGWSNLQEWKAASSPGDTNSTPNLLGNPGTNIATLTLPFTPSNFVVAVGQLDGFGAEEIVIGADGDSGTNVNSLLILTQRSTGWSMELVDVGLFGVTSLAIGQAANRQSPAIYGGFRKANGPGRIVELSKVNGSWNLNAIANSTNDVAFVLGVHEGATVLTSYMLTNLAGYPVSSLSFSSVSGNWTSTLFDSDSGNRGLGITSEIGPGTKVAVRLLDAGGIEISGNALHVPTNMAYRATAASWYTVSLTAMNWHDANSFAQTMGGHLASVTDLAETDFVVQFLGRIGVSSVWIGLNDLASEGAYVWTTGEPATFMNWSSGEPNDQFNEDAVQFLSDGKWNDFGVANSLLGLVESSTVFVPGSFVLAEPSTNRIINWRGLNFATGSLRSTETQALSLIYTFIEDENANGSVDLADKFVTAEYAVIGTNTNLLTVSRHPVGSDSVARSYGVTTARFLRQTNEVLFTAEPNGCLFAWTAADTNALQRQLFSMQYTGKGWHALAAVKALDAGEGLVGLLVDPAMPNTCHVVFWPPQRELPRPSTFPQTAPLARIMPSPASGGALARVRVRLWDAEANASLPLMEYRTVNETNWHTATIAQVGLASYDLGLRVQALPTGVEHDLYWNTYTDLGNVTTTNVFLRVRARDVTLLGDWSEPSPYRVDFFLSDSDGDDLPDNWELTHGLDFRNAADGLIDSDGDGFINRYEYLADTDPRDTNSVLKLTLRITATDVHIDWQGGTNATQYLQKSFSLHAVDPWFDILTNLPPTSRNATFLDSSATNGPAFYRIRVNR